MKKSYFVALLALVLIAPFSGLQAQPYHPGDSLVCQAIMATNFSGSTTLNWNDPNPANWIGVTWNTANPSRIIALNLNNSSCDGTDIRSGNHSFSVDINNLDATGATTDLTGNMDVSGLAMLEHLGINRNANLTGINVAGLSNLKYLNCAKTGLTSLDVSGLSSLEYVHGKDNGSLTSVNASNCATLYRLMLNGAGSLTSVNMTGSTALEKVAFKNCDVTSIDFTGLANVLKISLANCANLTSITNLSACVAAEKVGFGYCTNSGTALDAQDFTTLTNAYTMGLRDNGMSTFTFPTSAALDKIRIQDNNIATLDASMCSVLRRLHAKNNVLTSVILPVQTSLDRVALSGNQLKTIDVTGTSTGTLGIKDNILDSITGITTTTNLTELNANNNKMKLTQAVEASLVPVTRSANNSSNGVENQFPYAVVNTVYPDSVDYTPHELIDVNSTMVASSFQLFDNTMTPIGAPNATGKFYFLTAGDIGTYFVQMSNSGVTITTDSIIIGDCAVAVDTSTSVAGTTITSNETGGALTATYRWLDCDNNMAVIAGETAQNFTATVNGNYAVEVTVGCSVDTSACVGITSVGIEEMADINSVAVYPNPIKDQVTIELLEDYNNVTVMIMNIEGKMVYNNTNVRNNKLTIRTTDWKQGIYMVKVFSDEFTNTYKLIK